ncbi:MAG TPA: vanadium-dependent haloperoxidase [Nocardioides sp.]|nr:vanadium-dependent haloperoxidase [Nocardioides sp.]
MSDQIRPSRRHLLTAAGLAVPATALAVHTSPPALAGTARRGGDDAASTLAWHDVTAQVVAAAAFAEPVTQSRTWAIGWLAAARATRHGRSRSFSTAALAQALHDTLVALVPSQQAVLDSALASTLGGVSDGAHKRRGTAEGRAAATRTLAERVGDGLDTSSVDVPWTPPPAAPGVFQLTPPVTRQAIRAGQGNARPFLLHSNDQFDPGAPYSIHSKQYATDLAEVRAIGGASSPRTAEQNEVALFWYPAINSAYVQITRALVAASQRESIGSLARFVAAFNVITTDAQIAIYNAKYRYVFWRPYTAITTGDIQQDSTWTSYQVAPQHPEYPSGHGGQIGSQQGVLEGLVGRRSPVPITLTSSTAPGVSRTYTDWATISREVIDARVWEGVHYRTSDVVGATLGQRLARWELGQLHRLGI